MGGGAVAEVGHRSDEYTGRITWPVIMALLVGGSAGAVFGYDQGVSGGVISMHSWQVKFFPDVVAAEANAKISTYCKFDNQLLQLFTSSLYLAGMFGSLVAGELSNRYGRRNIMITSAALFLVGTGLSTGAQNLGMLIVGRLFLGLGVGVCTQSAPLFLSEMAPYKWRGTFNFFFQLLVTTTILVAGVVNYKTAQYSTNETGQGWRLSLGIAAVPGLTLLIGAFFVPDSPASLVNRGKLEEAHAVLKYIRGCDNVDVEFEDLVDMARLSAAVPNQWKNIGTQRYRPQLILCLIIPMCNQLTGINSIIFYAPQLFSSIGKPGEAALLNTVIIGAVNVAGTIVGVLLIDRVGRRWLFMESGAHLTAALVIVGVLLGVLFGQNDGILSEAASKGVLAMVCIYIGGFAWSWGPLGWLIPTEINPIETRSAGCAIAVAGNMFWSFVIGQCFLSMLCSMQYGVFFFFAACMFLMTIFVYICLPETKGVPQEAMESKFRKSWFWGKIVGMGPVVVDDNSNNNVKIENLSAVEADAHIKVIQAMAVKSVPQ